jgi:hypothetical protein
MWKIEIGSKSSTDVGEGILGAPKMRDPIPMYKVSNKEHRNIQKRLSEPSDGTSESRKNGFYRMLHQSLTNRCIENYKRRAVVRVSTIAMEHVEGIKCLYMVRL